MKIEHMGLYEGAYTDGFDEGILYQGSLDVDDVQHHARRALDDAVASPEVIETLDDVVDATIEYAEEDRFKGQVLSEKGSWVWPGRPLKAAIRREVAKVYNEGFLDGFLDAALHRNPRRNPRRRDGFDAGKAVRAVESRVAGTPIFNEMYEEARYDAWHTVKSASFEDMKRWGGLSEIVKRAIERTIKKHESFGANEDLGSKMFPLTPADLLREQVVGIAEEVRDAVSRRRHS